MRFNNLLALVAVLMTAVPAFSQGAPDPGAVLAPGDAVKITVWRREEMSGEFPLAPDGTILHPLYRNVRAAGVPLASVEAQILENLRRLDANPQFVVQPLFRVAVVGNVRTPDLYSLPPGTTAAQAIAMAGGPTDRGRLDRVRLLRNGTVQTLDLTRAGVTPGGVEVRSGDQILVPQRVSVYRDYIAPASGLLAAGVALVGLILQQTNR